MRQNTPRQFSFLGSAVDSDDSYVCNGFILEEHALKLRWRHLGALIKEIKSQRVSTRHGLK